MKAYLKVLPYMGIILGLLGLLVLLAFSSPNYCQLANNDFNSVELQTKKAIESQSFEMARYHAFKALNLLEKSKAKLYECECPAAIISAKDTETSLKAATKSKSIDISRKHLKIALDNSNATISKLKDYHNTTNEVSAKLDDDTVLNTNSANNSIQKKELKEAIEKNLTQFENSLLNVTIHVGCKDAQRLMNQIREKSNQELSKSTLTDAQRRYHKGIEAIIQEQLLKVENCNSN